MARSIGVLSAVSTAALAAAAFGNNCRVGVVWGGAAAGNETVAQLADNTYGYNFSVSSLSASDVDTLSEAQQYDVLIFGDSGFGNDSGYTSQMYGAIKQYLQGGGGVVTTGWWNYLTDSLSGQDAADADFISPIDISGYSFASGPQNIVNSGHPITNGIGNFTQTANLTETSSGKDASATALATHSANGQYTILYDDTIGGRSVYLGGLYLANAGGYGTGGMRSGVEDQLLEQAVNWSCGAVPAPGSAALLGLGALATGRRRR